MAKIFLDQAVESDMRIYDKIGLIATGQGDGYTTSSLFDYNYFNKYYKMIAIHISKQQALMLIQKQYK